MCCVLLNKLTVSGDSVHEVSKKWLTVYSNI